VGTSPRSLRTHGPEGPSFCQVRPWPRDTRVPLCVSFEAMLAGAPSSSRAHDCAPGRDNLAPRCWMGVGIHSRHTICPIRLTGHGVSYIPITLSHDGGHTHVIRVDVFYRPWGIPRRARGAFGDRRSRLGAGYARSQRGCDPGCRRQLGLSWRFEPLHPPRAMNPEKYLLRCHLSPGLGRWRRSGFAYA
jgi:hypothetical protein